MEPAIKRAYDLLESNHPDEPPLYVGDTVYTLILEHPREPRFIVDAKVTAVDMVFTHPRYSAPEPNPLWLYIYEGSYEMRGPKLPIEKDELGWTIYESIDASVLFAPEVTMGNWFIWIDLPIGHALSPYDEVSTDLNDLWDEIRPFKGRKRHAKSALHRDIRAGKQFIADAHKKSVARMDFPRYRRWPERKIYWRRK